jgi:hypothetical protein
MLEDVTNHEATFIVPAVKASNIRRLRKTAVTAGER